MAYCTTPWTLNEEKVTTKPARKVTKKVVKTSKKVRKSKPKSKMNVINIFGLEIMWRKKRK